MTCEFDEISHKMKLRMSGVDEVMEYGNKYKSDDPILRQAGMEFAIIFTRPNIWNGHMTMEKVRAELLNPTPDMAGILSMSDGMFDRDDWTTQRPRRKVLHRLEDGDEIDIDRWRDREPDMWKEARRVQGARFGVRIGVNVSTSASVVKSGFRWRTSAVVAMLRMVEELCIPCEVMCYECCTGLGWFRTKSFDLEYEFPVKRAEHLLDVDLLGYVLGDRSFFRVGILGAEVMAIKETFRNEVRLNEGLGQPREHKATEPNEFVLRGACIREDAARAEVRRFKNWLIRIREQSKYNLDGLKDLTDFR